MAVRTAHALRGSHHGNRLTLAGARALRELRPVRQRVLVALLVLSTFLVPGVARADAIRLRAPSTASPDGDADTAPPTTVERRKGFDYEAFRGRLEAFWFQRKAFVAAGRDADAANQSQLIRAFCAEEGVRRLDDLAVALLFEAKTYMDEGNHARAFEALDFAEFFAPGSAAIHRARAKFLWASGAGLGDSAAEGFAALRAALFEQWRDLSLVNHLALVLLASLLTAATLFALLLLGRHQAELRHEVEERLKGSGAEPWSGAIGWTVLLLPLALWIGAGWAVAYWLALPFRYLKRAERAAVVFCLLLLALMPAAFRIAVAFRAVTEDPMVRTTLASRDGAYEPERVVKLQNLVATHPDDPTYRFLLARLYANGRYFEEAFAEYKKVLGLDPRAYEAYVNLGNIQFRLGQYGEAVVQYRKAIESRPSDVLAYYDAYVTHSEWFRFKEAQEYLEKGNALDAERMAQLLNDAGRAGGRMTVVDATVDLDQVWLSAMEGKPLRGIAPVEAGGSALGVHLRTLLNPWSVVCMLSLAACLATLPRKRARAPARLCQRCGRPFCSLCKTERDKGRDYCNQCVHLFVLCDGLAAETKTRKLYEVDRHARITRTTRRIVSWLLPGGGMILAGRPFRGAAVLCIWTTALLAAAPALLAPVARLSGFDIHLGRLRPTLSPAFVAVDVLALLGIAIAACAWAATNLRIPGRREA